MNIYQRAFSEATKKNIKLFPLDKDDSFYKRRKIFRKAWKLKIDPSDLNEDIDVDDEEIAYTKSVLDEPFEMDCLGCDYSTFKNKCPDCTVDWSKLEKE